MDAFLTFFETMPNWQKLSWIFICLSLAWLLEAGIPLIQLNYRKWKHALVNIVFLSTSIMINVVFTVLVFAVCTWTASTQFGLFHLIDLPIWVELILAIMILDLIAQYLAHYLLHKVSFMWRFHMVHHSDTKVDATTGTRHHPGDYVIREIFALSVIFITGMPLGFYLFYRILTVFFTYISHANISLPKWLDKTLSYVFVTPDIHKFHHHFERPWTDTNFGNIFSLWDRMFGTFVYDDPKKIQYGLDVLDGRLDEDIAYQFKVPFDKTVKTDY